MTPPPIELFLSDNWIAGVQQGVSARAFGGAQSVSSQIGSVFRFAETATEAIKGVSSAVTSMQDIGQQVVTAFAGGTPTGIAGIATAAIQLLTSKLFAAIDIAADQIKENQLAAQWDVGCALVLKRTEAAGKLPGGANYKHAQPGWKKDFDEPAVPPLPHTEHHINGEPYGIKGKLRVGYRYWTLFTKEEGNPYKDGYHFDIGCFTLGQGGCALGPLVRVGLSLLTFPVLVEDYSIPWGGACLAPLSVLLTTPTAIHVQQRVSVVDALEARIRGMARLCWRIKRGPPIASDALTIWPDGTYTTPPGQDPGQFGMCFKGPGSATRGTHWSGAPSFVFPGDPARYVRPDRKNPYGVAPNPKTVPVEGDPTSLKAFGPATIAPPMPDSLLYVSPEWCAPWKLNAALKAIRRFRECRAACLRNFGRLPIDVQLAANKTDFTPENIAAWGGPYAGPVPPIPTPKPNPKR